MLLTAQLKLCVLPPKHCAGNPNSLEAILNEILYSEEKILPPEVITLGQVVPIHPKVLGKEQKGTSPGSPKNSFSSLTKFGFISREGQMEEGWMMQ